MQKLKQAIALGFLISLFLAPAHFNTTSAQDNGALKDKTEMLLSILDSVNGSLVITFKELTAEDIEIPFMSRKNYREGNLIAKQALSLADEGKYLQARSRAVEALQSFKEALKLADEVMPSKSVPSEEAAQKVISLKAAITRKIDYIERLENMYNQTNAQGFSSVTLSSSIEGAKRHLNSALKKIEIGDVQGSELELTSTRKFLSEAEVSLNRLTNNVKALKTKEYLVVAEKRLTTLRDNIAAVSLQVPLQVRNASITALNRAESSLQNAKELMDNNNVDETINELVKSSDSIEESVKHLESTGIVVKDDTEIKP